MSLDDRRVLVVVLSFVDWVDDIANIRVRMAGGCLMYLSE